MMALVHHTQQRARFARARARQYSPHSSSILCYFQTDFSKKVSAGARYRLVGELNAFNFVRDDARIYVAITTQAYPERLVFPLLNELIPKWKAEVGDKSGSAPANSLDRASAKLFAKIVSEYDDPAKKDKLAQVQQQVQDVKLTMHRNIDGMVRLCSALPHSTGPV